MRWRLFAAGRVHPSYSCKAAGVLAAMLLALAAPGCGRQRSDRPQTLPLPVQILADTAASTTLAIVPPRESLASRPAEAPASARIWIARVEPAPRQGGSPVLPDAVADTVFPATPPTLEIDSSLEPPILRRSARLVVPEAWRRAHPGRRAAVELDVLIEESGEVDQVEWAGGSADSTLIEAAKRSAEAMRFYPALKNGHPVAVWCRQRFDFETR